ncbi:hypothetical protein BMH32_13340 [Leucobacter sp. OLJS4]|nr:hypothetical protein BMH25_03095 [Leucobacter sp. OLCALW19]PII87820.1 hypothetical protein BMH26_08790 [Leucobacter sp. OLTLW20]PII92682.1 hypothetical protein BMH27_04770 [Leucobacter sp. OLAS13]PII98423.1 hypothetical protein BMH29_07670 [Leucobacter sp. OLDS2]PIJ01283.1 hypothetical protein BMH28_07075 [Leucobacter sp. OLCS4]PIJ05358.1 hypothetical protein BMH31_00795 [Leucobacter sp. OLIS6]PIJ06552.1 hypothetical protein BMH32_13340 [Leucobacter sp. OLJS4]PIJ47875.1 hypothetical prote
MWSEVNPVWFRTFAIYASTMRFIPASSDDPLLSADRVHWCRLVNPTRAELDAARERHGLHPLIVEDLLGGRQQPKAERFDGHLSLFVWDVHRRGPGPATTDVDLVLILTADVLLIVQRGDAEEVRPLDALLAKAGPVPVDSPISAAYCVLEAVVRDFVDLGTRVETDLDELEAEVFDSEVREDYRKIYRLRQQIGRIDRAVRGLSHVLDEAHSDIQRATARQPELRPYFRHLENDARGVAELTATEYASLDAIVSSHESNVAARQNQDMRTISAVAALLAIPTVIAGIYGMNFKNLPLVQWEGGWIVIGVLLAVVDLGAYLMFRRRGWLGPERPSQE